MKEEPVRRDFNLGVIIKAVSRLFAVSRYDIWAPGMFSPSVWISWRDQVIPFLWSSNRGVETGATETWSTISIHINVLMMASLRYGAVVEMHHEEGLSLTKAEVRQCYFFDSYDNHYVRLQSHKYVIWPTYSCRYTISPMRQRWKEEAGIDTLL